MATETLEDHLRRATRNFTARLPEDRCSRWAATWRASSRAPTPRRRRGIPSSSPPRSRWVEASRSSGRPRPTGATGEDLFQLGALLHWLATGQRPEASWRLDGPPEAAAVVAHAPRRAGRAGRPVRAERFASAAEAAEALDGRPRPDRNGAAPWPLFRGDAAPHRRPGRPAPASLA